LKKIRQQDITVWITSLPWSFAFCIGIGCANATEHSAALNRIEATPQNTVDLAILLPSKVGWSCRLASQQTRLLRGAFSHRFSGYHG
jgi:hypothetical protein